MRLRVRNVGPAGGAALFRTGCSTRLPSKPFAPRGHEGNCRLQRFALQLLYEQHRVSLRRVFGLDAVMWMERDGIGTEWDGMGWDGMGGGVE